MLIESYKKNNDMNKLKKAFYLFFKSPLKFIEACMRHMPWLVSDKCYVMLQYKVALGYFPDLENPKTFTEKLQWLKLYDHNPLYTRIVDKVTAKEYIKEILGEEYIIPTLHVWDNADDIDIDQLPDRFVLKCNHTGGGSVFICHDKSKFDFETAKKKIKKQLKKNTFLSTREWPYKNVKRKVFCEQYMEDESGELRDYKFYCFNGKPEIMLIASNRFTSHNFDYFDMDFKPLGVDSVTGGRAGTSFERPEAYDEMIAIASKLSQGFPHVRVDLYYTNHHIYFGELTFYDSSGFDDMNSEEWNNKLGDLIKLPEKRL